MNGGGMSAEVDYNDISTLRLTVSEAVESERQKYQEPEPDNKPEHDTGIIEIGNDFTLRPDGVYRRVETEKNITWVWICSRLNVLAQTRNNHGEAWGMLLEIKDPDGNIHPWAMPYELMKGNGDEYRGYLLSLGMKLGHGSKVKAYLHEYLNTASSLCELKARCVERIGWHNSSVYVLPDGSIGFTDRELVVYQSERADHNYRQAGTLEEWKDKIASYCVGNSRLALAVSMAFAAPMLTLTGNESGGVHFVGNSSTGKTTAATIAGSVNGGGEGKPNHETWNATANGVEVIALEYNDNLLILDEIKQISAQDAGATAYMLGNGQGKKRMNKDSSGKKRKLWTLLFLSTGEVSLAEKMSEAGQKPRAGQEVRLVDIPADAGCGYGIFEDLYDFPSAAIFADYLKSASLKYYGTAQRAFLTKLVMDIDCAVDAVKAGQKAFVEKVCPEGSDGQVLRVAGRFGLIGAAGELAIEYNVLNWPKGEAVAAAITCFNAWLENRGGVRPSEITHGINQVVRFFQNNGDSRFKYIYPSENDRAIINMAGYYRINGESGKEFLVYREIFKDEVCKGFNSKLIISELARLGHLKKDSDGKNTQSVRVDESIKRLYVISENITSDSENDL